MSNYKALIFFDATEDSYKDGEIGNTGNSWDEILTADTKQELKEKIEQATYCNFENGEIVKDDINEYGYATEYWASYLANEENQGEAYPEEVKQWKRGKLRLWSINCHILVSEVTEKKAEL